MAVKKYTCDEIESLVANFAFPEYRELVESRETVDDCLAGQNTIKSKQKYLPPNDWQAKHQEQYKAYLRRALFPGETQYALDIYDGLFSLGEPNINLVPNGKLDFIINNASVYEDTLKSVQLRLNNEQMTHGLRCLLVEVKDDIEKPFFIREYNANKFLRSHFTTIDGNSFADFILLDESTSVYDLTTFTDRTEYRLLILALDGNGNYYQRAIHPTELNASLDIKNPPDDGRTVYPAVMGRTLRRIPFVWCGVKGLSGTTFEYPPLKSLADTELALYSAMANHSQHIYMNTQEILVFTGVSPDAIPKDAVFGCGSYLAFKNSEANARYVSTNGVGFTAEKEEIQQYKDDIANKRLSLMSAKSHQSGTVVGMTQNNQSAPLRNIVNTSGEAITQILRYMAMWLGEKQEDIDAISYTPSQMFANPKVNLAEYVALCQAVYNGEVMMREEDLYNMARESGYINTNLPWNIFKKKYKIEQAERQKQNAILPKVKGNPFAKKEDETQVNDNADAENNSTAA